jgi:hypothetical protein
VPARKESAVPHVERLGAPEPGSVDAEFETLLAQSSAEVAATARALRRAVEEAIPAAVQQIDMPDRLLSFGTGPAMRDLLFAIIPHTSHVNLQLADGADLPNQDGLIEGTGKRIRHVKVRSVEAAGSRAVRAAIDAQVAHRRRYPMDAVASVSWGVGRIDLFWRGEDGGLVHRAFTDGAWAKEESLGGTLASPPVATAWATDQLEVFAVFPDGQLWDRYWDGTSWHAWESLGGELDPAARPAASSWSADRIDVFARGRDGAIWHRWWDGSRWVEWEQLS